MSIIGVVGNTGGRSLPDTALRKEHADRPEFLAQ